MSTVDERQSVGPFDVIGDVHGCADELEALLERLGYGRDPDAWRSPDGRTAIFVGDFVDRGPRIVDAVRIARDMVSAGTAFAVPGNHDIQLLRYLQGDPIPVEHGLDTSLDALADAGPAVTSEIAGFLASLPGHVVVDGGRLVVAHAGLGADRHLDASAEAYQLAVYGVARGPLDAFDVAKRHPWLPDYRGPAVVVYGHTAVQDAIWDGETINIDTGCVYGGRLTAVRWPERLLVSVPARRAYAVPVRPLTTMVAPWR